MRASDADSALTSLGGTSQRAIGCSNIGLDGWGNPSCTFDMLLVYAVFLHVCLSDCSAPDWGLFFLFRRAFRVPSVRFR
jgi:hypothetical protein